MLLVRICMLLLCIQIVFSEICVSQTSCQCVIESNRGIDLTLVGKPDLPRFHDVAFDSNCTTTQLYSYNPCYSFNSPDKGTIVDPNNKACIGAAACVRGFGSAGGNPPEEHVIGYQATAEFGINGQNYYINYSVPGSPENLTVNLICNNSTEYELTMVRPLCEGNNVELNLTSKYVCIKDLSPTESTSHGLSTGSILLIMFFTLLLAYLLVGIVWNFCSGSQGIEVIPNISFWNELPVLIMEGVSFTCSCFGRNSSYGEV